MNARVQALVEQAKQSVPTGLAPEQWLEVYHTKFAEMIVRECVSNLEIHSTCFDGDVGRGIKTAARLTKEHFGVES